MCFRFPLLLAEFEIPDSWWAEAGMTTFCPHAQSYRSTRDAIAVPLRQIEPPFRNPDVTLDWHGFDRARLVDILAGIVTDAEIPPVPVLELPPTDLEGPFRYRVCNGLHRFYASVAAGFECLPAVVR